MMRSYVIALTALFTLSPAGAETLRVVVQAPGREALTQWLQTAAVRQQLAPRHRGRSAAWSSFDLDARQWAWVRADLAARGAGWRAEVLVPEIAIEAATVWGAAAAAAAVDRPEPGALHTPDDPLYDDQWGLGCADFERAWGLSPGRRRAVLAILDTGVDLDHPELAPNLVAGIDLVNQDDEPDDDQGHGTAMAAVAAAVTDNGAGMAGCVQELIMPVKVLDAHGMGYVDDIALGIDWATAHGAAVIALGLVVRSPSPLLEEACARASAAGVLLYAAAGSDGGSEFIYPAAYTSVSGIGAISTDCTTRAPFNNWGFGNQEQMGNLELMAPGVEILTIAGGGYELWSGTSMACAFAAALGTAYRDAAPGAPATALRAHIQAHADPRGDPDYYGYGVIDAAPWIDAGRWSEAQIPGEKRQRVR